MESKNKRRDQLPLEKFGYSGIARCEYGYCAC
jgi:hypothetical protein